ncbi:Wss1p-like protein [Candida albicans P60002]|nr:hypothetical protein MGQ_02736 [Candida albicans P76067]KHC52135.1 Wss1p-like protein [Candida albicans P60002]
MQKPKVFPKRTSTTQLRWSLSVLQKVNQLEHLLMISLI